MHKNEIAKMFEVSHSTLRCCNSSRQCLLQVSIVGSVICHGLNLAPLIGQASGFVRALIMTPSFYSRAPLTVRCLDSSSSGQFARRFCPSLSLSLYLASLCFLAVVIPSVASARHPAHSGKRNGNLPQSQLLRAEQCRCRAPQHRGMDRTSHSVPKHYYNIIATSWPGYIGVSDNPIRRASSI